MLLAEANQWPEDAIAYFGAGDECHMAFHFPLMPRLFMAMRMEDRYPVTDILQLTPPIPENCQWALFLRNHDELTLEMVTDEERDYMYRVYAQDRHMRINLGIRRRLAPLLENDRRRIELMNGLLFSLPGHAGDLLRRRNRHGRQHLSGRPQRRAHAHAVERRPQRRLLARQPAAALPAGQHRPGISLRSDQRRNAAEQSAFAAVVDEAPDGAAQAAARLGRGTLEFLHPENRRILAFTRSEGDERVLVVANLSRFAQCAELDLARYPGMVPLEVFGKSIFRPSRKSPTFFPWARTPFTGSRCSRGRRRRTPARTHGRAAGGARGIVGERLPGEHAGKAQPHAAGVPAQPALVPRRQAEDPRG